MNWTKYSELATEYESELNAIRTRIDELKAKLKKTRFSERDEVKNKILRLEDIEDDILDSLIQIERRI